MRAILIAAATVGLVAGLAMVRPGILPWDPRWTVGLASGALLGTVGSLAGFWLLLRNLQAGQGRFLAAFFGGMLARWALFGSMVALVLLGGSSSIAAFLGGLIPAYLGFQGIEMWYLHRRGDGRERSPARERGRRAA